MPNRLESDLFLDLKRQQSTKKADRDAEAAREIVNRYSPAQLAVHQDHSRFRAVLASRRTGKSYWAGSELVHKCLKQPGANCLYVTLTRGSGRGILWNFLKQIDHEFGLNSHFHNTNLEVTYRKDTSSESRLTMVGAENRGELDKIRGQGYDLVVIDECKSFPASVLKELMKEIIGPALIDRMGRLVLIGTPGAILSGEFFEVTEAKLGVSSRPYEDRKNARWVGKPYRWSVHRWDLKDAALPHIYNEAMAMKEAEGWPDDHPAWLREYRGRWVASEDALVYAYERYGDGRNTWTPDPESENPHGLPDEHQWTYLLGLDLGFEDDFAIEVAAYSPTHSDLFQVYDFKYPHLTVQDMAREIEVVQKKFGDFEVIIGDAGGLGKLVLATLEQQYGISVIAAEKKEKLDHVELLNSDYIAGRVKVLKDSCLAEEATVLQFDSSGIKEHPGCANHCCDAFLYLWRWAYHHYFKRKKVVPESGTPEWNKLQELVAFKKAVAERQKYEKMDWWEPEAEDIDSITEYFSENFSQYIEE